MCPLAHRRVVLDYLGGALWVLPRTAQIRRFGAAEPAAAVRLLGVDPSEVLAELPT